jgi:hypothetical protein
MDYTFTMSMFTPPDHTQLIDTEPDDEDQIQWNSGYTASEIAAMRIEKEKQIKELELSVRMAEAEYKIMEKEASDGTVYAQFDGVVVSVLDPDTAYQSNEPLLKVSGGGGFYVEGSVSELLLDSVQVGQEVQITSWYDGGSYVGIITEVGDYPSDDGDAYYGSSNVTYYPYTVFIDESANLREGYYVEMSYQSASQEGSGLYLELPFVLEEGDGYYVYVRNDSGLLEKRKIQTGKTLWGSYIEIRGGLTEEDYIAFPYGKTVREGASTVEGNMDALWS